MSSDVDWVREHSIRSGFPLDWKLEWTDYGCWRVKETATHFIDVAPMIYNHRVVTTPKNDTLSWDRGWCYPSGVAAVLAAMAWDPDTQDRPVGWIKEVHTGERPNGERY